MSKQLMVKLAVDLFMTILMVLAMAYHFTGNLWHEIIGMALFLLFFIHNFLNRRWYTAILKGRYDLHRALNTTTNLILVVLMTAIAVSGILLSRDLFTSITVGDDLLTRRIHTAAAHLGYLLIGIHLGMHWTMVMGGFRKMTKIKQPNRLRTVILRVIAVGIAAWGVKTSFDRNIWSQLTSRFTFSFWGPNQSAAGYLLGFLCIMGVYAVAAHYILQWIKRRARREKHR